MENMKSINLDGVDYQAEAKVIESLVVAKKDSADLQEKFDGLTTEKTKVEAERDQLREKCDAIQSELVALKADHVDASKVAEMVQRKINLLATAASAKVEVKADEAEVEIMKKIILAKYPKASLKEDAVYIQARFDAVCEELALSKEEDQEVRNVNAPKGDSEDKPVDLAKAKADYRARLQAASKKV